MIIHSAEFIKSSVKLSQCPPAELAEFAFIGRSNVGKSSLINMLTGRNKLAKTSSTPGKTQTINHFLINNEWYLVDLPGYGYAKVAQKRRVEWSQETKNYILKRDTLACLFVLIDCRIEPQDSDLRLLEELGRSQVPVARVFTKSDKQGSTNLSKTIRKHNTLMLKNWEELPPTFITSTVNRSGKDEILGFIEQSFNIWKNQG
jgi:GTP-binding protein